MIKHRKDSILPNPLTSSDIIISPAEVNCHRKGKITDVTICDKTKIRLSKFCDEYMDFSSKCCTDIGKMDLVQIIHIHKDNIKPLDQKPDMLPLIHYTWLRKELNDLENAGPVSSCQVLPLPLL